MGKAPAVQERRPEVEATTVVAEGPTCQHHWLIESPHGAMSSGRCKRCGAEREFRNSATDYLWEDESSSGYNAWRGARPARKATTEEEEVTVSARPGGPVMIL
jgi:hypothetical protein